jgi:hypothetical protein
MKVTLKIEHIVDIQFHVVQGPSKASDNPRLIISVMKINKFRKVQERNFGGDGSILKMNCSDGYMTINLL